MESSFQRDKHAEFALSAMVSMIMILLFSAIVAGLTLMMVEQAFMESRTQSVEQSETLNSIPYIVVFELEELDTTGNTNDRLYIMFKLPYASNTILDTNIKWAMMCDINDYSAAPQTNSQHTLEYSSGDFDAATDLTGNAADDAAIDEFVQGTYYHIIIQLSEPDGAGDCDLVGDMSATLVIIVENGRTTELEFYVPTDATSGYDLMS
jgi:hypothetical protein